MSQWHILGPGSMGCLWAYYLQHSEHDVTLIAKDVAHCKRLQQKQVLTMILDGNQHTTKLPIITPEQIGHIDNLLITLKTYQTKEALENIKHAITSDTTLVLLQNGMENHQWLAAAFPDNPCYAAITTEAAYKQSDMIVEHTGSGFTQLGELGNQTDPHLLNAIRCELHSNHNPNIQAALWQKLVINCCINPLTAIYQCKNGELLKIHGANELIYRIIEECQIITKLMGKSAYLENIEKIVHDVITTTANNYSSMYEDIKHHRPTEIESMNGYVVRMAEEIGFSADINKEILKEILELS